MTVLTCKTGSWVQKRLSYFRTSTYCRVICSYTCASRIESETWVDLCRLQRFIKLSRDSRCKLKPLEPVQCFNPLIPNIARPIEFHGVMSALGRQVNFKLDENHLTHPRMSGGRCSCKDGQMEPCKHAKTYAIHCRTMQMHAHNQKMCLLLIPFHSYDERCMNSYSVLHAFFVQQKG